ncbi:MAG TPA: FHA domain-containing protein, partial [Thermoanaerobaculia bacterium]|nr:FHA domain-containing protein [Thermoanaerobaculia bacterium]
MTSLFRLHVVPAEGAPFDYLLRRDSLVVGRALDVDLTISDPFLSRRHSRFYRADSHLFVEDLGSRNGTEVNGRIIQGAQRLAPGDVIKVSNSVVTVFEDRPTLSGRNVREEDPLEDGTILRSASELLGRQNAPVAVGEAGLRRYADRLRLLNQIHQALGRPLTMEELVELILDRVFDHLKPDRGVILLKDGDEYRVAASRGGAEGPAFSRSLIREVEKGMAAVVFDVHADDRFSAAQSMLISGIRSLIAAPLMDLEEVLGLIVLESRTGARQFSEEDLELLVSLAAVAALHLRNLALAAEAAERRRLEEELALARRIQVAILPSQLPDLPGWELYGGNVPSR